MSMKIKMMKKKTMIMMMKMEVDENGMTLENDRCGEYEYCNELELESETKAMKPDRLAVTMETGNLDLRPTPKSLAIKEKNRQARQAKKELEKRG